MKTKLMQRVFSAIENEEDKVLYQLNQDIEIAKEDGKLDAEQYSIIVDESGIDIYDKVNNEITHVEDTDNTYKLSPKEVESKSMTRRKFTEAPQKEILPLGSQVTWVNESGETCNGVLQSVSGDDATVSINGVDTLVNYNLLSEVDKLKKFSLGTQKFFSKEVYYKP